MSLIDCKISRSNEYTTILDLRLPGLGGGRLAVPVAAP